MYEELSRGLAMTCPALLMRNTTEDPTWTSFIYHDHVSWFPGAGYVVEKLFREHCAERLHASSAGSFADLPDRKRFTTTPPVVGFHYYSLQIDGATVADPAINLRSGSRSHPANLGCSLDARYDHARLSSGNVVMIGKLLSSRITQMRRRKWRPYER